MVGKPDQHGSVLFNPDAYRPSGHQMTKGAYQLSQEEL